MFSSFKPTQADLQPYVDDDSSSPPPSQGERYSSPERPIASPLSCPNEGPASPRSLTLDDVNYAALELLSGDADSDVGPFIEAPDETCHPDMDGMASVSTGRTQPTHYGGVSRPPDRPMLSKDYTQPQFEIQSTAFVTPNSFEGSVNHTTWSNRPGEATSQDRELDELCNSIFGSKLPVMDCDSAPPSDWPVFPTASQGCNTATNLSLGSSRAAPIDFTFETGSQDPGKFSDLSLGPSFSLRSDMLPPSSGGTKRSFSEASADQFGGHLQMSHDDPDYPMYQPRTKRNNTYPTSSNLTNNCNTTHRGSCPTSRAPQHASSFASTADQRVLQTQAQINHDFQAFSDLQAEYENYEKTLKAGYQQFWDMSNRSEPLASHLRGAASTVLTLPNTPATDKGPDADDQLDHRHDDAAAL
ncbi:hypothetical protein IAT40_002833 [Kwoniella sp. CBS 6097]